VRSEQPHGSVPDGEPEYASRTGQEHALGDELSNEPEAPGTQGEPQGEFAGAYGRAARQQPCDVGARHDEDARAEREQQQEHYHVWPLGRHPVLQLGTKHQGPAPVRVRIRALEIRADDRQLGLRPLNRHARLQPPLDHDITELARLERAHAIVGGERRPHHDRRVEIGPV
jgi:hypothetical protein